MFLLYFFLQSIQTYEKKESLHSHHLPLRKSGSRVTEVTKTLLRRGYCLGDPITLSGVYSRERREKEQGKRSSGLSLLRA